MNVLINSQQLFKYDVSSIFSLAAEKGLKNLTKWLGAASHTQLERFISNDNIVLIYIIDERNIYIRRET